MKKLDQYLANLAVASTYLHNLHWNLKGETFKQVHEYLDDMYEESTEYLDEVAELQKMLGQTPLSSMSDYLEYATIEELETRDHTTREAIELALEYIKEMEKLVLEVRKEAEEDDIFVIANMAEDHYTAYLKHEWFLSSMLSK